MSTGRNSVAGLLTLVVLFLFWVGEAPAHADEGKVLMFGDSITSQACQGLGMQFPRGFAPDVLVDNDGGCYGFPGATTNDMNYMIQGWRFYSPDPVTTGQAHPIFLKQPDIWDFREAIDRASVIVVGLGTMDAGRNSTTNGWPGFYSPWPIQTGPGNVMGHTWPELMAQNIDYLMWLAGPETKVFWYDVVKPCGVDALQFRTINDQIWGAMLRHPNLGVLPWTAKVAEDPTLLRGCDVHMTDRGRQVRWELAADVARGAGLRP